MRSKQDEDCKKDMYFAFVNNALQQKANGIGEPFDELVEQFNVASNTKDRGYSSAQLRLFLLALSHVVSRLERHHSSLVEAIVNMPWATMDHAFVKSYTVFIGMLLSARPEYLSLVLGRISRGFTYHYGFQSLDNNQAEGSSSPLTRRIVYDRLHYLLRHLISLIPTLPSALKPCLIRYFPHKRQSQESHTTYIRNLFRVMEYCPELADRLLAVIIDCVLQIDVEIQVELEDLENDDSFQDQESIFELDPFDAIVGQTKDGSESEASDDSDDGDECLSDISSDAEGMEDDNVADVPPNVPHIQDMVKKLDAILKLLFDYFHRTHVAVFLPPTPPPSQSDSPSDSMDGSPSLASSVLHSAEKSKFLQRTQFHSLLSIFERTIIHTFKSRYTQFLLFWFSSLDPEFSDLFQGLLVSKALIENELPIVTRVAAASYIGSFFSRAQFVDREGTRRLMNVLCRFLKGHLDAFDARAQTGDPSLSHSYHSVFYAVTQAVLLIFCFRWSEMLEEHDQDEEILEPKTGKKWMTELDVLQRVVSSPLNPLKICSSTVVTQFARVAQATGFVYCYSIMEANRRSEYNAYVVNELTQNHRGSMAPTHPTTLNETISEELHCFFPFDPYRLPKSCSYIQSIYKEWSSVAFGDDDDEREGEDEGDEGYGGDLHHQNDASKGHHPDLPIVPLKEGDGDAWLGISFEAMSISPAPPALPVSAN